jgi:hypothetical protein
VPPFADGLEADVVAVGIEGPGVAEEGAELGVVAEHAATAVHRTSAHTRRENWSLVMRFVAPASGSQVTLG